MKKTVFSLTIIMAVIISAFSIFAMPASASLINYNYINPSDRIILSSDDDYYEAQFENFDANRSALVPLNISEGGLRIIQTFGIPDGNHTVRLELLNSSGTVIKRSGSGFVGNGYGAYNSFLQYNFTGGNYYIRVTPKSDQPFRLSITLADAYFDVGAPISQYEQIADHSATYEQFDIHTPAKVWTLNNLASNDLNGDGFVDINVDVETNDYVEAYIIDPSSSEFYAYTVLIGDSETEISIPTSVTSLYLVLMTRWGRVEETNTVIARINIEFLEEEI